MAVRAARGPDLKGELLRLHLLRVTTLLNSIADVAVGEVPQDRDGFVLVALQRGESLATLGQVLGVSRQRVLQIAQAARARSSNGS